MAFNALHHNKALTALFIEAKFAKGDRRWSRFGRRGETNGGAWIQDARKRYNKAHRKASKQQLRNYQPSVVEISWLIGWPQDEDLFFDTHFASELNEICVQSTSHLSII
jgi:hypothetical protein